MEQKQISLTMPEVLFDASKEYCDEYGYRNVQEFILDLVRQKVAMENASRYREIENRMEKGTGVKKFNQKKAVKYLKGL